MDTGNLPGHPGLAENNWLLVSKHFEETTGHVHDPAEVANRSTYL